jgi:hypothetical protein
MRSVRAFLTAACVLGMTVGGLTLFAGCDGGGANTTDSSQIKDAPPMSPDQQKSFDEAYKKKTK